MAELVNSVEYFRVHEDEVKLACSGEKQLLTFDEQADEEAEQCLSKNQYYVQMACRNHAECAFSLKSLINFAGGFNKTCGNQVADGFKMNYGCAWNPK